MSAWGAATSLGIGALSFFGHGRNSGFDTHWMSLHFPFSDNPPPAPAPALAAVPPKSTIVPVGKKTQEVYEPVARIKNGDSV